MDSVLGKFRITYEEGKFLPRDVDKSSIVVKTTSSVEDLMVSWTNFNQFSPISQDYI